MRRNFVDLWDISPEEGWQIIQDTLSIKKSGEVERCLTGKNIALYFTRPSTRTRVSFEVAIHELGGNPIFLHESSLQASRGEDVKDTARTLSRYTQGVIIRTDSHKKVEEFARYSEVPVVNALTDMAHPCQILSDVFTLYEVFGEELQRIKIAYLGDGNNVCNTWLVGAGLFGLNLFVATPEGYEPSSLYYQAGEDLCRVTGGNLYLTTNPIEAVKEAHVIYTDVWVSMNQNRTEEKIEAMKPYQVRAELLSYARPDVKVMHCLPARKGEEITEEVFEAFSDFIFTQTENRLHTQKALLKFLFTQQ